MISSDSPAFPVEKLSPTNGLTKKEYFVGLILQGLLNNVTIGQGFSAKSYDLYVDTAIAIADKLLEKLD